MTATGPSMILDLHLVGRARAADARLLAFDGEEGAVVARPLVDVRRGLAAAGVAVAEIPGEAVDDAVDVGRTGAVELHLGAGAGEDVRAGAGHRPLVDADGDLVGADPVAEAGVVADGERHRVGGALRVRLGRVDDLGARYRRRSPRRSGARCPRRRTTCCRRARRCRRCRPAGSRRPSRSARG